MADKADGSANRSHNSANTEDDRALAARLDELGRKIEKRQAEQEPPEDTRRGNAIGTAFRLATELVAGLVVGGGIGWFLDLWLGTSPLMLLVFFFLGAAAGVLTVYKTAGQLQAQYDPANQENEFGGKSAKSDDVRRDGEPD